MKERAHHERYRGHARFRQCDKARAADKDAGEDGPPSPQRRKRLDRQRQRLRAERQLPAEITSQPNPVLAELTDAHGPGAVAGQATARLRDRRDREQEGNAS